MRQARIVATRMYESRIAKVLPPTERLAMEADLAEAPDAHPVVSGTGGVRKARWKRPGTGKRGGIRVIYFYLADPATLLMIMVYSKVEKEDLTPDDKKAIRQIVATFRGQTKAQ